MFVQSLHQIGGWVLIWLGQILNRFFTSLHTAGQRRAFYSFLSYPIEELPLGFEWCYNIDKIWDGGFTPTKKAHNCLVRFFLYLFKSAEALFILMTGSDLSWRFCPLRPAAIVTVTNKNNNAESNRRRCGQVSFSDCSWFFILLLSISIFSSIRRNLLFTVRTS